MKISVVKNNIHIENSYEVKTRTQMENILNDVRKHFSIEYCEVLKRTNKSMINEWASHNLLYKLRLFKTHTKDVDLNYPQNKTISFIYTVISYLDKKISF